MRLSARAPLLFGLLLASTSASCIGDTMRHNRCTGANDVAQTYALDKTHRQMT
jgi:hypothetical protein